MRTILPEEKNPVLRQKANDIPVADIKGKAIQKLIAEMKALLAKEEYGVALAAPQVGVPLKLFVISGKALARDSRNAPDVPAEALAKAGEPEQVAKEPPPPDQVYINPKLVKMS